MRGSPTLKAVFLPLADGMKPERIDSKHAVQSCRPIFVLDTIYEPYSTLGQGEHPLMTFFHPEQ
jgi:hypothetical protein